MFEQLAKLGDAGSSNIFEKLARSHPETQERIQNAKAEIQQMKPLPSGLVLNKDRYQQMIKRLPAPEESAGGK